MQGSVRPIILFSIATDARAWEKQEEDFRNTIGAKPSVASKVDDFSIMDMNNTKIKSSQINGDILLILWNLEDQESNISFIDQFLEWQKAGVYEELRIVPVNIGDKKKDIENFLKTNNYSFDCYMDADNSTKWAFNRSQTTPIVYLIDDQGIIRLRQEVGMKSFNENLLKRLELYLGK